MNRRNFFIVLITVLLFVSPACGSKEVEETAVEAPSGSSVPWLVSSGSSNAYVPEGEEIGLLYGWLADTEEQVQDYFKATKHEIFVNGIPVIIKGETLGDLEKTESGYYYQDIWMNIGELPVGDYELRLVMETTEKVYDGLDYYGPGTDNPTQEVFTTITVGGEVPSAEAEEEGADPPPAEEAPAAPVPVSCTITSPIKTEWNDAVCETFDSGTTSLWIGRDGGTSTRVEEGEYIIDNSTSISQGFTTGFIYPVSAGSAPQHMISVDGTMESRFKSCAWGVYVRSASNEITYFFMITNEGRYMLTGSSDEESRRFLGNIDAGSHNSIIWDGTNNITALADGKHLEFYINDKLVLEHEAINATNPNFGLIVWGGEGVDALNRFDNLLVRAAN